MRLYIAGPMTGIPQFNIPAFDRAARALEGMGYDVVSPAELDGAEVRAALLLSQTGAKEDYPNGMTHGDFLARDVKLIADDGIEAIGVLSGWEQSPGALHETFVARQKGLPIFRVDLSESGPPWGLDEVSDLALFRAWTGRDDLFLSRRFSFDVLSGVKEYERTGRIPMQVLTDE